MRRFHIIFCAPLALLAGCETTLAVNGMLGEEKLSGSLTHYSDGGTIELFGDRPMHCVGNFSHRQVKTIPGGIGTLVCDDRRVGPFSFAMKSMKHGSGTGTLGGQPYSFSF